MDSIVLTISRDNPGRLIYELLQLPIYLQPPSFLYLPIPHLSRRSRPRGWALGQREPTMATTTTSASSCEARAFRFELPELRVVAEEKASGFLGEVPRWAMGNLKFMDDSTKLFFLLICRDAPGVRACQDVFVIL